MEEKTKNMESYIDPEFNAEQLKQIRLGLSEHLPVDIYAKKEFDADQMKQIRLIIMEYGWEVVNMFCNNNISADTMSLIRQDMRNGDIDVNLYATRDFSEDQMREIRLGLKFVGDAFKQYINVRYDSEQLREIRLGLENGIDVTKYATLMEDKPGNSIFNAGKPAFKSGQMREIRLGLMLG